MVHDQDSDQRQTEYNDGTLYPSGILRYRMLDAIRPGREGDFYAVEVRFTAVERYA